MPLKEFSEDNVYPVTFFLGGKPTRVFVDGNLPIREFKEDGEEKLSYKPVLAQFPRDGSVWVAILEKAWAKVFGNYNRTASGKAVEPFYALTGAPTVLKSKDENQFDYHHYSKATMWNEIRDALA